MKIEQWVPISPTDKFLQEQVFVVRQRAAINYLVLCELLGQIGDISANTVEISVDVSTRAKYKRKRRK